jgi:hypothetical protein
MQIVRSKWSAGCPPEDKPSVRIAADGQLHAGTALLQRAAKMCVNSQHTKSAVVPET